MPTPIGHHEIQPGAPMILAGATAATKTLTRARFSS
jgi:hypothetical protein